MTAAAPDPGTEPAPHLVEVELTCDGSEHPGEPHDVSECYRRRIICPGITLVCQMWMPCPRPECKARSNDDEYSDGEFHGAHHRWFRHDGSWWGVPEPGSCFYRDADGTSDAIYELGPITEPGSYPVDVEAADDNPVFHLIPEATR